VGPARVAPARGNSGAVPERDSAEGKTLAPHGVRARHAPLHLRPTLA
jgi:hypothetical protein